MQSFNLPHSELHISDHIVRKVFRIPEELSLDSVGVSGPMHWRFTAESHQTKLRSHLVVLQLSVEMLDKVWQQRGDGLHAISFAGHKDNVHFT